MFGFLFFKYKDLKWTLEVLNEFPIILTIEGVVNIDVFIENFHV